MQFTPVECYLDTFEFLSDCGLAFLNYWTVVMLIASQIDIFVLVGGIVSSDLARFCFC